MAHANLPMAANKTIKPSAVRCSIMIYYRFFIFFWFSTISFFSFTRNLVVVVFFLGSSSSSSPLAGSLKTRKGTIAFHAGLVVLIASSFSVCVCVCVCVCECVSVWLGRFHFDGLVGLCFLLRPLLLLVLLVLLLLLGFHQRRPHRRLEKQTVAMTTGAGPCAVEVLWGSSHRRNNRT